MTSYEFRLRAFLSESNQIEGIAGPLAVSQILPAAAMFLETPLQFSTVLTVQKAIAPEHPLRNLPGMNVQVGHYIAPPGGPDIPLRVADLIDDINSGRVGPWKAHVVFEDLHPFMDGNGRTGRLLWAKHMLKIGQDPFALPFLHRFYYQTLQNLRP